MNFKGLLSIIAAAAAMTVLCSSSPFSSERATAQWIGAPWDGEKYVAADTLPAPELKKDFKVKKGLKSATAYVTGLGFFELYMNGVKVGNDVLSPNETSYTHREGLDDIFIPLDDSAWRGFRVAYLTYDVTDLIRHGRNEVSALLGNGWFSTGRERWGFPYGTPRFICRIALEYGDGSTQEIVSDGSWKARRSAIVLNDIFDGESYDAREENRSDWEPVMLRKAPDGKLVPQEGPSDRVMEILTPKRITRLGNGDYEVEFGDYVTGWVRLFGIDIPEGSEILVEFPIETPGNGNLRYISNGRRCESYAPKFTWWAFEKVIVKGWKGELLPSSIRAEVVHSDIEENGEFECSNPLLNRICAIWKRTLKDNAHLAVLTDCPHRERGPYTGDGEVSCVTAMHNFDMSGLYRKWMHDMSDCQDTLTGYVPSGAPWHPGCGGGVAWGAAMCIIPWEYYLHYGDREVLEENYGPMKDLLRYMQTWRLPDGTMLQARKPDGEDEPLYWYNLGEWCAPWDSPSQNFIHTWYLWRCADYTARAAHALGHEDESACYRALADDVAAAFHKKFRNPETGSYTERDAFTEYFERGNGSNAFAIAMGVPEEGRQQTVEALKRDLKECDGHINTGILGTTVFFDALCDCGLAEEAYEAMTKTDFPSYGDWVRRGAVTFWEDWAGQYSRVHPMFGSGLVWLYRRVCGVQTDEDMPGYRHIIIRPTPVGDLKWASYTHNTKFGTLSVKWERNAGEFSLEVTIPEGAYATAYLPDGSTPITLPSGHTTLKCDYLILK